MKKNILLILTDQQRKDSLGCYGISVCQTPNLDKLAANGIRFERNYVANPICMPNRLSICTGQNIRSHGLWTNGLEIDPCRTIADHLHDNGYQTASIGKIHFGPYGGDSNCLESENRWKDGSIPSDWQGPYWGFDHVELTLGHTQPLAHYGKWFYEHGGTDDMLKTHPISGAMQSGTRDIPEALHDSSFVADRTIDYLQNSSTSDKPFFLVASFPDPHHPFDPPAESAKKYASQPIIPPVGDPQDLESRPPHYQQHFQGQWHREGLKKSPAHPNGISKEHETECIQHTYAMVDLVDQNIGKILDCLEKLGLREDTIILFTSDHGELLGDHGLWFKGPFFYEGLINTPLIISVPNGQTGVSDALFSALDIAPTLCDLADIPPLPFTNGVSQKEHIFNLAKEVRTNCLVEYRTGYGNNDCSSKVLVTKNHKYVRYQNGQEELTDLEKDPCETRNEASNDKYSQLKQHLQSELIDTILSTEPKGPEQISHA